MKTGLARFVVCSLLVSTLMVGGCSGSPTAPTVDPPTVTETFSGTLSPLGFNSHPFTVSVSGVVTITLTAAGPPSTVAIGVGVGTPTTSDPGCSVIQGVTIAAASSPQLTGTAVAGAFCLAVADVGNLSADITYSVTVVHP